jgi:hypothetical protein
MTRAAVGSWLALALLAGAGACDGSEIVVFSRVQAGSTGANSSAGGAGLAAGSGGSLAGSTAAAGGSGMVTSGAGVGGRNLVDKPCRDNEDCDQSLFCQKQDCADVEGVCLPTPLLDDPRQAAVCGCDHKTYWNDTFRQRSGIPAILGVGPCGSGAQPCATSDDCCSNSDDCALAACSIQLRVLSACGGTTGLGQCWMIPTDCASADDKPVGLPCPPPGPPPPTPPPCLTLCQALQARQPFLGLRASYTCP